MRPREPRDSGQHDLLRSRLDQIIDTGHALAKLARTIDWDFLSQQLGAVYTDQPGRPPLSVFTAGQKRGVTDKIKRELRRRSAVEPVIGHLKSEHRMDRNHLKGRTGDAANAILAAAGYNFRLLIAWITLLWATIQSLFQDDDQRSSQTTNIAGALRPMKRRLFFDDVKL